MCIILLGTNSVKPTDEAGRRRNREAGEREFRDKAETQGEKNEDK